MSKWLSSQEVFNCNNTVTNIISKMENYFAAKKQYVNPDLLNLSAKDIDLIDKYPNLFFKCSPKRILLVKWIVDETENFFKDDGASAVFLDNLYTFLRGCFKTHSLNKENLQKLFQTEKILEYETFVLIRDNALKDYKRYYNSNKNSVFLSRPKPEVEEIKKSLQLAKEDLGEELCKYFLKNINEAQYLYKVLSYFVNLPELEEEKTGKLKMAIENINDTHLTARLKPLLSAYKIDNKFRDNILKLFIDNNIVFVEELHRVIEVSVDSTIKSKLLFFVEWLAENKLKAIKQEFNKIFKTERNMQIMKIRAAGATLEEAGQEVGITRERVRQIERRILTRFNSFLLRKKAHYILQAYSENDMVLTIDAIKSQLGEISDVFIYCLKKCNKKEAMWSDKLRGFVIGDRKWYEQLVEHIEALPEMFEASALDAYVADIKNMLDDVEVEPNIIRKLIISDYTLYGKTYTKRKISKADVYLAVLDRFYPDGIKLFDDFEMMRFRNYAKELFGDIDLPENDRAICARIADMTVLCDRGKYILSSKIKCDDKTIDQIFQFIVGSPRNVIMFGELFERFKTELLEKTNITNRFFLQGVLKYKYATKFYFTKDTLIKDINSEQDVKLSIEEFIREQGRIVTKDEVREEFLGISDAVLQAAIANNPNILLWNIGSYLHKDQLFINEATKIRLKKILDGYTVEGSVSVQEIYNEIYLPENDFLLSNNIDGHIALYSVFNCLFPNDYEFSRPFIAPKGSSATTFNAVVQDYLSNFDEVYISELKDYVENIRGGNISVSSLLDDISDEFIRVDSDLLIRKDRLVLSEGVMENIEETTLALIGDTGYLSVKKMDDYIFYPDIGVKWSPFLLVSLIKHFSKKLKIINSTADYRYLNEIIVNGSLNIDNYDELLRYALKKEDSFVSFKNMQEIKEFLLDQGLITKNIPQSLFEKGYLKENEYGGIAIV